MLIVQIGFDFVVGQGLLSLRRVNIPGGGGGGAKTRGRGVAEECPGAPATEDGSTGVEKVYSRWASLTRSQTARTAASTPMRQTPTRGCSPLPVCTLTWKRGRGFCTDVLTDCSTPTISPSPPLPTPPPLPFFFSRPARFRAAKEYLKRCSRASFQPSALDTSSPGTLFNAPATCV